MQKSRSLWFTLLILVMVFSLMLSGCGKKQEVVKETELGVNVATAASREIAQSEQYAGIVRGKNEVAIMPKAAARVTSILVKPGDYVTQGQTLVTLDSSDYEAGVRQAEAGLAMAEAGKRANDVQLENARANYERIKKLHEAGAMSDKDLDMARGSYEALTAGTAEAGIAQAQAGLMQAQTQLNHCIITSPINGTVGSINVSLGDTPSMQSPVAVVSDTSQLEIEVMVSESDISYITSGSEVDVHIKAAGDDAFKGVVESISSVPDTVKRSYAVKVSLPNDEKKIKSGMFAEVSAATQKKSGVICVPRNAVVPKGARTVVYTIDKEKRAQEVEVTTGISNEKYIEITKGLKKGEKVITKGSTLVNEGTLVRVITGGDK